MLGSWASSSALLIRLKVIALSVAVGMRPRLRPAGARGIADLGPRSPGS